MTTVELGQINFDEAVRTNDVVLVAFWATWWDPCQTFSSVFEDVSQEHEDVLFATVDTGAELELAARFGIMSLPTVMAFRDSVLLYAQPGALPASALRELVREVKGLDMDEVRRQLAGQEAVTQS